MSVFKKAFLMGLGAISVTKDKAEQVMGDLVKKGDVTKEEARELFDAMLERGREEREQIETAVKSEVEKLKTGLSFAPRKDVDELKRRIEELERRLQNTEE